jgi:hypothetical protein
MRSSDQITVGALAIKLIIRASGFFDSVPKLSFATKWRLLDEDKPENYRIFLLHR